MSPTPTTMEEALAENARLRSQVQRLEEMVARLEARLNQDSQNSSKPPSTARTSPTTIAEAEAAEKTETMEDLVFDPSEVRIYGKVVTLLRRI